ncbi:TPA: NUDIX hydrolase, partial [Stenotrophomonas maltophilia]
RALGGEAFVLSEESLDLAWRPVTEVASDPESDESMQRMARRWLAR